MLKKVRILEAMNKILSARVLKTRDALVEMKDNRDSEAKSSMGDKYETGRSLMQMEMSKLDTQLDQYLKQKRALAQIDTVRHHQFVDFGSLVETSIAQYFISIGLGKVEVEGQVVMCISMASPIGKAIQEKKAGEKISFQGREIFIKQIY
jgi:transcription elongation GreA/GreB family factor